MRLRHLVVFPIEMMSSGCIFSEIEDDYEAVKSIIGRHPMNQFEVRGFLESRDVKDPEAMMEQMKKMKRSM